MVVELMCKSNLNSASDSTNMNASPTASLLSVLRMSIGSFLEKIFPAGVNVESIFSVKQFSLPLRQPDASDDILDDHHSLYRLHNPTRLLRFRPYGQSLLSD